MAGTEATAAAATTKTELLQQRQQQQQQQQSHKSQKHFLQVTGGSESNGKTVLRFSRPISTCFVESFDYRDVGDSAAVRFVLAEQDLATIVPTPADIYVSSSSS